MEKVVFDKSENSKKTEKNQEKKEKTPPSSEKEIQQATEKLDKLLSKSRKIIFRASSFFPLNFFPDEISLDLEKINITTRIFFFTGEIQSMEVADIVDVVIDAGPFFASMTIKSKNTKVEPIMIKYLKKSDAIRARKLIQGIIALKAEGVDLSKIPTTDEIIEKIEKIGATQGMKEL